MVPILCRVAHARTAADDGHVPHLAAPQEEAARKPTGANAPRKLSVWAEREEQRAAEVAERRRALMQQEQDNRTGGAETRAFSSPAHTAEPRRSRRPPLAVGCRTLD